MIIQEIFAFSKYFFLILIDFFCSVLLRILYSFCYRIIVDVVDVTPLLRIGLMSKLMFLSELCALKK